MADYRDVMAARQDTNAMVDKAIEETKIGGDTAKGTVAGLLVVGVAIRELATTIEYCFDHHFNRV